MIRKYKKTSYRRGDPSRRVLAAILKCAVTDFLSPTVSIKDKETARNFLAENGQDWLRAFGISPNNRKWKEINDDL